MLDTENTHLQKMGRVLGGLIYRGDRHVVTPSGALGKKIISRRSGEGVGQAEVEKGVGHRVGLELMNITGNSRSTSLVNCVPYTRP